MLYPFSVPNSCLVYQRYICCVNLVCGYRTQFRWFSWFSTFLFLIRQTRKKWKWYSLISQTIEDINFITFPSSFADVRQHFNNILRLNRIKFQNSWIDDDYFFLNSNNKRRQNKVNANKWSQCAVISNVIIDKTQNNDVIIYIKIFFFSSSHFL